MLELRMDDFKPEIWKGLPDKLKAYIIAGEVQQGIRTVAIDSGDDGFCIQFFNAADLKRAQEIGFASHTLGNAEGIKEYASCDKCTNGEFAQAVAAHMTPSNE